MNAICVTCGTQFGEMDQFPESCPICEDERQYVGVHGQRWTTLDDLRRNYRTTIEEEEAQLTAFSVEPKFGIGQRAFLIQSGGANILWDCISLLDDATVQYIKGRGGLEAIAISHPHYYSCMVEWSTTFGDVPIYIHRDDVQWVMRPDKRIKLWDGETCNLPRGLKLICCGGHFAGACVLFWPEGSSGRGALLTGDTIQVVPDRKWVSFMYSYPNYIPLQARDVEKIVAAVQPFEFESLYGAFPEMTIPSDGKRVIERSAERYLKAIAPDGRGVQQQAADSQL
jgi:glyoxylase-like metal-dependent hydrolase (beta-lactamase superfamily II)